MIVQAQTGTFCNYCMDAWGGWYENRVWRWHKNAQSQAKITIISKKRPDVVRNYCLPCLEIIQTWPTNPISRYPISEQVEELIHV